MRRVFICLLLIPGFMVASEPESNWQNFILESPTTSALVWAQQDSQIETDLQANTTVTTPAAKSIKKGFLYSAVIPGAGQAYSGSFVKAIAFFTIEVGAWVVYAKYQKKGKDIEADFQAFAEEHWIEDEYWDWIYQRAISDGYTSVDRNNIEDLKWYEREKSGFSHSLHVNHDQQYYEMIGKYHQFNAGWDDADKGQRDPDWSLSLVSKRRLYYEDRRNDSNIAYQTAKWATSAALLNHVISAAEAAWSINKHNKGFFSHTSVRVQPMLYDFEVEPALTMNITW